LPLTVIQIKNLYKEYKFYYESQPIQQDPERDLLTFTCHLSSQPKNEGEWSNTNFESKLISLNLQHLFYPANFSFFIFNLSFFSSVSTKYGITMILGITTLILYIIPYIRFNLSKISLQKEKFKRRTEFLITDYVLSIMLGFSLIQVLNSVIMIIGDYNLNTPLGDYLALVMHIILFIFVLSFAFKFLDSIFCLIMMIYLIGIVSTNRTIYLTDPIKRFTLAFLILTGITFILTIIMKFFTFEDKKPSLDIDDMQTKRLKIRRSLSWDR
jgi:hypothetical protein